MMDTKDKEYLLSIKLGMHESVCDALEDELTLVVSVKTPEIDEFSKLLCKDIWMDKSRQRWRVILIMSEK